MNRFKKLATAVLLVATSFSFFSACTSSDSEKTFEPSKEIGVITREEGSGTRGAFIELFGVEEKNKNGENIDRMSETAAVTNSTSVMMTTVAGDLYSIGYISMGSLDETVKAVPIDHVVPTIEHIKDGSYVIKRPFNIITGQNVGEPAQDFINFILSSDGQAVIEESGYISPVENGPYQGTVSEGKVVVSGSSSVTPVMEKLKEAYMKKNPSVSIEVQQSDSSTGIADTIDGTCDIGMSSRELKQSELDSNVTPTVIAMDGIVVIVNNDNPVTTLSREQVKSIFTGESSAWSEFLQ